MTLFNELPDQTVLAVLALFAAVMTVMGYRRGFMLKLLSLGSVAAALIAEALVFPRLMEALGELSWVRGLYDRLGESLLKGMIGNIVPEAPEGTYFSGNGIFTGSPLYDALGLDTLAEHMGQRIGGIAAGIILFILIFIAIRVALKLVAALAKGLRKMKLIKSLDGLLGAALGLTESVIYIWILMLAVSAFPGHAWSEFILRGIQSSEILAYLYANNLILLFFAGMTGAISIGA